MHGDTDEDRGHELVPMGTAAAHLGITPQTLKKRIQRGQQPAIKRDGRWFVTLNGTAVPLGTGGTGPNGTEDSTRDMSRDTYRDSRDRGTQQALDALERALTEERAERRRERERASQAEQAAAMWQARAGVLEEEAKRLHAQLALPAPQPEPALVPDPVEALRAKVDELSQQLQAQPAPVAPPRPWWQRWRRAGHPGTP